MKEKREETLKIKAKTSVKQKAEDLYFTLYPYAENANLDDLFEQMVSEMAFLVEQLKQPKKQPDTTQQVTETPIGTVLDALEDQPEANDPLHGLL